MPAPKPTLSPRDLARVVGVSESSLKRWADDGLLQISRTTGGHRRIGLAEAASYIRRSGLPLTDPKPLGFTDLSTLDDGVPSQRLDYLLVQAIRRGDRATACGLTLKLYLSGRSVCEICDGPMKHALRRDPAVDHAGSFGNDGVIVICLAALQQLNELLPTCSNRMVGLLPNDSHPARRMVSEMMRTVLTAECWQSVDANVADASAIAHAQQAKLLAAPADLFDAGALAELSDTLQRSGCQLVIVGHPPAGVANVTVVESMSEFASLVRFIDAGLHQPNQSN